MEQNPELRDLPRAERRGLIDNFGYPKPIGGLLGVAFGCGLRRLLAGVH
jgi:hypothetical protein